MTSSRSQLPPLLVLTDRHRARRPLREVVQSAVDGGVRVVLLREKDLPRSERLDLACEFSEMLAASGGMLLVASDATVPAAGVHLGASDPWRSSGGIVGRSCHDHAEVAAAAREGCDYVTLSPVFATASKPGYGPVLGVAALAGHSVPVYALGGITPDRAARCVDAGAAGVAVMGAVMTADDPARVVACFLEALADSGAGVRA